MDAFLTLLQLSDSAFPVGAAGHSGGLEGLVYHERVTSGDDCAEFARNYLHNLAGIDLPACLLAQRLGLNWTAQEGQALLALDLRLSSLKISREGREASRGMGRRFLHNLEGNLTSAAIHFYDDAVKIGQAQAHQSIAFGLAGAACGAPRKEVGKAYAFNALSTLIAAAQRLLPLGQTAAQHLLTSLQPEILSAVVEADLLTVEELGTFTPGLDFAAMRHSGQPTRLFIS